MIPETLLNEIGNRKCWVNYSARKIPINPKTLHNASVSISATWSDYHTAALNIGKLASLKIGKDKRQDEIILGVGLILGEPSGLCGIDLDHVISEDGRIDPEALEIIRQMNSYTEYSPSGTGIHILFRGKTPVTGSKVIVNGKSREMYGGKRFFTVTGDVYEYD